jgi:hypothetical protein
MAEKKEEKKEVDFDAMKGNTKVKFMKMHSCFAQQKGDEVELRNSAIARHKLIELNFVHKF